MIRLVKIQYFGKHLELVRRYGPYGVARCIHRRTPYVRLTESSSPEMHDYWIAVVEVSRGEWEVVEAFERYMGALVWLYLHRVMYLTGRGLRRVWGCLF